MAYTPEQDSVAGRVCAFFLANPTDELTSVEISQQFGKASNAIPAFLASCVANQLLARRKDEQMNILWFAGPKLATLRTTAAASAPIAVQAPAPTPVAAPCVSTPAAEAPKISVEISQLAAVDEATVKGLKGVLAKQLDRFREPYTKAAANATDGRSTRLARELLLRFAGRTDTAPEVEGNAQGIVKVAFELADAFIAELDKRQAATPTQVAEAA